ncbi:hypothetical protein DY000_02013570 [Brassica cretica]|uniref:Uncharacterized protein n=1 Tax=Brassica cretica TaxID=69181 RepID=A0ABQ7CTT9_BRACR|nr:hypothetical protein DY000_02013570 [Brassica cretica]
MLRVSLMDSEAREVQGGTSNIVKAGTQGENEGGRTGATVGSPISIKDDASKTNSPWLKNSQAGPSVPVIEVVGGVASMQIPEDTFDESELLWKSFVVGFPLCVFVAFLLCSGDMLAAGDACIMAPEVDETSN